MIWRSFVAVLSLFRLPSAASAQIAPDLLADAERGNADAQLNLGVIYLKGKGVPENEIEATKWYRLAAEQGNAEAQYNLGLLYATGAGVATNFVKAYAWLSMAAAQGNESASENKGIVTTLMTPQQIAEGQAYATRCFENDYKGCD
ncbi:tetratricopeptide repeat protein [Parasphingorhabdus sp.]|uniref:tetratricopeptide repeat protein n=1 Tax=Parasphingorhabdus sp. TaxID=2709688 RepID=UPI0030B5ABDB|nr:sel1 repeat family protein [Sphingomonadales bacterium]